MKKDPKPGLTLIDAPYPTCGIHDVIIKVKKASICGTDVHIYKWDEWASRTTDVPVIIGHEFMGEIVEVGSSVKEFKVGDRVSGEGHITCGICELCKNGQRHLCPLTKGVGRHTDGCFAEYISLPSENIFILPEFVPDDIGAIFDPFGNAMHTALSFPLSAKDVLITGAGPIGIMAAAISKKAGACHIFVTDVNSKRLEIAKKMGATETVDVSKESLSDAMKRVKFTSGFDVGMEMSGSPNGFSDMLSAMKHGGSISLLGILPANSQIHWDDVIFKMLMIKGIYGREIFKTWYQMINMLASGLDITPVITHRLNYRDFEEGFDLMIKGKCGKVILDWET